MVAASKPTSQHLVEHISPSWSGYGEMFAQRAGIEPATSMAFPEHFAGIAVLHAAPF